MGYIRACLRVLCFLPLCVVAYLLLLGADTLGIGRERKNKIIRRLYAACMRVIGLSVTQRGEMVPGPALIVANHCSYNDVLLIASMDDIFFTPKSEVKSWPLIGPLVARFNVLFVDRKPGKTAEMKKNIIALLESGGRICVFPEATTGDGRRLLPFKSSLFALAEDWQAATPLPVQPMTVIYRRVNGQPIDDRFWPKVAWYGSTSIVRHLFGFFALRHVEAEVIAHPPITLLPGESRKQLCDRAAAIIASAYPAAPTPQQAEEKTL